MKKLRPDPYPNPIDVDRYPELAGLDEDLRKEAMGLPVKRSEDDVQFMKNMNAWLDNENKRKESDRIFASLGQKQQRPQRQVSNVRQRKSNERPRSFNHFYALLQAERYDQEIEENKAYEEEQRRLEQKWIQHSDSLYA